MKISARNQIDARVTAINRGEAVANVQLEANCLRLEGSEVVALVKASDLMVATRD